MRRPDLSPFCVDHLHLWYQTNASRWGVVDKIAGIPTHGQTQPICRSVQAFQTCHYLATCPPQATHIQQHIILHHTTISTSHTSIWLESSLAPTCTTRELYCAHFLLFSLRPTQQRHNSHLGSQIMQLNTTLTNHAPCLSVTSAHVPRRPSLVSAQCCRKWSSKVADCHAKGSSSQFELCSSIWNGSQRAYTICKHPVLSFNALFFTNINPPK